jgi:hypothetical protein
MANIAVITPITSNTPATQLTCSFVNKPAISPMVEINQAAMGK